jgi:hypothetical protein
MRIKRPTPQGQTPDQQDCKGVDVIARGVIVGVAAVLVGVQVVRNAAVLDLAATSPAEAARLWRGHPASEISAGMTEIARAARDRRQVPETVFASMADAAVKEPLAPEPFLVRGVRAELAGDGATAQRAFEAAQWRDPRSLPAADFLADRYFRLDDVDRGLKEVAALSRLSPSGAVTVAPYIASYATAPINWPSLRRLFRDNPDLAGASLTMLARNAATAPAVLALADPRQKMADAPWLPSLLDTLTQSGKYAQAWDIWVKAAGIRVRPGEFLHDSAFVDRSSPPPFNWELTASAVGLAERQPGGRLHVIFYGQEDGFLASQLLLLPPGAYRLSMQLLGDPARSRALSWSVWCDKATGPLVSATVGAVATHGLNFQVPEGCSAQWIRLAGASSDMPQQIDVMIAGLKLERGGPGA